MSERIECPFCGSEEICMPDPGEYECYECERWFDSDDLVAAEENPCEWARDNR